MYHDDQAVHQCSLRSAATIRRLLASPVNCKLIHRPPARQPQRRQQES